MKKIILALLLSVLMITTVLAASAEIGDGTSTSYYVPFNGLWDNNWSHFIVPGDAITNAIDITTIEFNVSNTPSNYETVNQTVYLKLTTATTVTTDYTVDPAAVGFTQIFDGSVTWDGSGWQGIQLTTPFAYDGTSNLEIIWENRDGSWVTAYPSFYYTTATAAGAQKAQDGSFPAVSGNQVNYYPNTRVSWQVAGEPDAPVLVTPANGAVNVAIDTNLEWTTGDNTDHSVIYIADNAEFTAPLVDGVTATSPYTTSLDNGTTYYWKVVAVGTTTPAIETSSAVRSFTTAFGAITEFPYEEGFEDAWIGSPAAPAGWSQITVSGSNYWNRNTSSPHTGSACAQAPWASAGGEHLLVTPTFDLDASTDYRLKFWLKGSSYYDVTSLTVQIASSYSDETSFTEELAYFTGGDSSNMPTVWTEQIISLAGYTGNQTIAFRLIDDDGMSFYIDDVTIEEIPETPIVEINTDPIEFATVAVHDFSASELVTIKNIGGGTLNITDVSLTGTDNDQFSLTEVGTHALAANEELIVNVTFSPTSEGAKTATLQITDDFSAATHVITLTGTGVDTDITAGDMPYTQDFETVEGFVGWKSTLDSENTSATSGRYESSYNAHSGDFTHRFYHPYISSAIATNAELISPLVVPDMDAYRIRFWAKKSSSSNTDPLIVGKYDQAMENFTTIESIALTNSYVEYTVDLVVPTTKTARTNERIAFKYSTAVLYSSNSVYIDDVTIEEIPTGTLVQITPDVKDFGNVHLGYEASQTFTIANNGVIAASISEVTVPVGFSAETQETYPVTLGIGESFTVDVTFTPLAEMTYSGNLTLVEDMGTGRPRMHYVALTGAGIPVPQGTNCSNPLPLTFPAVDVTGNTVDFVDDYSSTWISPNSSYIDGDDVVYQFTLANTMLLNGTITTTGSWIGAFILQDEPNVTTPAPVILQKTSTTTTLTYSNNMLPAGTYYLIISSYPSPQSIDYTINLTADPLPAPEAATNPSPADEAVDQPTALTLAWTNAAYTETIDLWFGTVGAREMALVLDDVAAVEEYAVTDLVPNTEYAWKVVCRNYTDETIADSVVTWSFTTIGNAPDPVTYTSPADEATDVALAGNLVWAAGTGANGYDVYLSTDENFTGVEAVDQTATTYAYSGLEYSTTYYWKVIPYNVVGQPTEGIEVWSFTTIPDPTISTFPWTETFTTWPAENWSQFSGILAETTPIATGSYWYHDEFANIGSTANSARLNIYSTRNHWLVTPPINLDANVETLQLDFDIALTTYTGNNATALSTNDYVAVVISTDNGVTWSNLNILQDWANGDAISHTGDNYSISLEGYSGIVKLGFYAERPSGTIPDINVYFDNIRVREIPTDPIAQLSATEIDLASVLVNETSEPEVVTITNVGVGELIVSNVEITGDDAAMFAFDELTLPATLLANEMLDINVTFSPTSEGEKTATLTITDNTDASPYTVTLTGTGLFNDNNNTPETATELTLDVVGEEFAIAIENDIDWYKFYCIAGTELNMYSERETSGIDTKAWFYGPNLEDGSDIVPTSYNTSNDDGHSDVQFEINTTCTEDGWYYLRVAYYGNGPTSERLIQKQEGSRASTGIYWLHIYQTLPPPAVPVVTMGTANGLAVQWLPVENAVTYQVWACDTPDGTYELIDTTDLEYYLHTADDNMKFFKVKASTDPLTPSKGFRRN